MITNTNTIITIMIAIIAIITVTRNLRAYAHKVRFDRTTRKFVEEVATVFSFQGARDIKGVKLLDEGRGSYNKVSKVVKICRRWNNPDDNHLDNASLAAEIAITVLHELIHHQQNLDGRLEPNTQEVIPAWVYSLINKEEMEYFRAVTELRYIPEKWGFEYEARVLSNALYRSAIYSDGFLREKFIEYETALSRIRK